MVWPQDFTEELISSFDPDLMVIDTRLVAGFRRHYRELWVAPLVDSFVSGERGYHEVARFTPQYFERPYFAAIDPELDVEVIVLEKQKTFPDQE